MRRRIVEATSRQNFSFEDPCMGIEFKLTVCIARQQNPPGGRKYSIRLLSPSHTIFDAARKISDCFDVDRSIASLSPLASATLVSSRAATAKPVSVVSNAQIACSSKGTPDDGLSTTRFRAVCKIWSCSGYSLSISRSLCGMGGGASGRMVYLNISRRFISVMQGFPLPVR